MSINFSRNRAQTFYEDLTGAAPEDLIHMREEFRNHILTANESVQLKEFLNNDAVDFFYNGVLSFSEGIDAVFRKRFSWATIKLYYAVYYLIRASLASKGIAILRCKSMFRLVAQAGEKPYATTNKKYNTTHEGTINHYRDIFNLSDRLLSNKIEDDDAYEWLMNAREIVNYRSVSFSEPECMEIWDYFSHCIDEGTLPNALAELEADPYIMCFQEEYAIVAIPIKRMQQTITDMLTSGILRNLSEDRTLFAKSVIGYDERSLSVLSQIF